MEFQTAYGPKVSNPLDFKDEPRLTEQSHKQACDINYVIRRHDKTGILTHLNTMEGQYGDVTGLDFQNALDLVTRSNQMFEGLPSHIRAEFQNNPALFLDYCNNPENLDGMREKGLISQAEYDAVVTPTPTPEPAPEPAPVVE
jgi:phage internal scaffolding protein